MSEYAIIRGDDRAEFDDKDAFEDSVDFLEREGVDFETKRPISDSKTSDSIPKPQGNDDKPTLREDPIAYLRDINDAFVNKPKGQDAISKRGFRYIQAELDITTESEVVGWVDDPYGVVVWARAELPNGRSAEAHGEGYPRESDLDPSEFVRYADTRAKNRALSDLTSAGALAVDELQGGIE